MADTKISALTASTTPLAGTEVLPIVQGGVTKQVSVANLTAGRAVSGSSVTASTGNFVVGTAGQGIDFSINPNPGGMTSELLNDYEEGTWTPVVRGSTTAGTYQIGTNGSTYTKVGRTVTIQGYIQFAAAVTGGGAGDLQITGLPFTKTSNSYPAGSVYLALGVYVGNSPIVVFNSFSGSTTLILQQNATGGFGTAVGIGFASANAYLTFTLSYEV